MYYYYYYYLKEYLIILEIHIEKRERDCPSPSQGNDHVTIELIEQEERKSPMVNINERIMMTDRKRKIDLIKIDQCYLFSQIASFEMIGLAFSSFSRMKSPD